jgi:hypothetical protein
MEKLQKLKLMMQMNKMAFDNNYALMMNIYEQNNFLLYPFLNQSTDIPAEAKTALMSGYKGTVRVVNTLKKRQMTGTKWWRKVCPQTENDGNIQWFSHKPESILISIKGIWEMMKKPRSDPNPTTFNQSLHQVANIYLNMVRGCQNYSAGISRHC